MVFGTQTNAYYLKWVLGTNNAYYLKWALGRNKRILPQMGFGSRSWEPKGNFSLKLGAETPSRAISEVASSPLKNPLGPQLRVLAVWGIIYLLIKQVRHPEQ